MTSDDEDNDNKDVIHKPLAITGIVLIIKVVVVVVMMMMMMINGLPSA